MKRSTTTRVNAGSRSKRSVRATEAKVIAALTLVLLLGLPYRGQAQVCSTPNLTAAQDFAVGSSSASVAVGDFNHDGSVDLAVTNGITSSVSILHGDGTGDFGTASDIAVGTTPYSVATGDFNNDTYLDLAVADLNGALWVLLGGPGGFGAPSNYLSGPTPASFVVAGQLHNTTNLDLAVVDYPNSSGEVSVLSGNGNGTFVAGGHFPAGGSPAGAAFGDFNGDGHQDLAVTNLNSNTVSVLLGNGTGALGTPSPFPVGNGPIFVAVADFNGDLKQDLAVTNLHEGTVSVLLGMGTGSFASAVNYAVGTQPSSVAVGDFNGDGKNDLVVANASSHSVSVLLGDGIGHFGAAVAFPVGHSPGFVAAADFNGDGLKDIVTTAVDSNVVSVLLNACGSSTHDTVVLPVKPVAVTIPLGKPSATKKLSVKVRNADPTHTSGYNVMLVVDDSDCGVLGTVASTPDFVSSQPGAQNSVLIADGRTKTAKVVLTVNASALASVNHKAPHRCTLWFTSSADVGLNGDPTPSNNTFPVELSVTDLNDPDQTGVETTIDSLKPITLNIASGKSSKIMTARPKIGNASTSPGTISAAAQDGTCPTGTVGAVHFSTPSGIQLSATLAGGTKKSGTLQVTGTNGVCTPNKLAPQRCIATVSATGPVGDTDGTNNTTHLVIDMVDKNDTPGSCIP